MNGPLIAMVIHRKIKNRRAKRGEIMISEGEQLDALRELGIQLSRVQDLDILMEKILSEARRFVNADAGSIYIRDGDVLNFSYTQNDTVQQQLDKNEKLIYSTFTLPINTKSIAGYVASTGLALNIEDAYGIPPTSSYQFDPNFDDKCCYRTGSMLTIPLKTAKDETLGILQVINAQDESKLTIPFSTYAEKMMLHFASIASVALERAQMTRTILLRMIRMAEMRDPKETGAHVNRVGGYAVELYEQWAKRRGIPLDRIDKDRDILRIAAMLHDVGKVGISDLILKKPGRFTDEEFQTMKQHTLFGAQLFDNRKSDFDDAAADVALTHHERWDGNGYPGYISGLSEMPLGENQDLGKNSVGKTGEEIPLYGRIVALADVYDALSSVRVYKQAWDEKDVLETISKESGRQFDPELVEIFFSILDVLRSIQKRFQDKP
jgi:HD-GYP domain-containing protein (c-di-GMP phosphodiesterase class II)